MLFLLSLFVLAVTISAQIPNDTELDKTMHPNLLLRKMPPDYNQKENLSTYWHKKAQNTIFQKLKVQINERYAKNIILFMGDGMSVPTVTATRMYISGEKEELSFEKFPYFGLSKTYCVDFQVADSACTSTAYLTGIKGNLGTVGVNGQVPLADCKAALNKSTHTPSIVQWAQAAGMATGFVTTARVSHSSPAGVYAHSASRYWESDGDVKKDNCNPEENRDITYQLVHSPVGKKLKVVMGGGRGNFHNITTRDEDGEFGWRLDNHDLTKEWLSDKKRRGRAVYISDLNGLRSLNLQTTDYVLGLFNHSHCPYNGDISRQNLINKVPTLTDMTEAAIRILSKEKKGFFLFVEGARIDTGHHENKARKALEETEEFARAIQKSRELTSELDTLIVVTADHSHTLTINGYPNRGNDILGFSQTLGSDMLPYTTLSYANGPGFSNTYKKDGGGRANISAKSLKDADFAYMATVPLSSETHGGDDVGIYAVGPGAHFFVGNYEQTNIPMLMSYAAQIGPYFSKRSERSLATHNTLNTIVLFNYFIIFLFFIKRHIF